MLHEDISIASAITIRSNRSAVWFKQRRICRWKFASLYVVYRVLRLPGLRIYGNFTARSSVSQPLSVLLVSLFAAVDTAAEGILTQVVPLQGRRRGLAALPRFTMIGRPGDRLRDFARRVGVPRRSRRPFRRLVLRRVPFADERNVPIDHVVLQIGRAVVVGLRQLRGRTTSFVLSLGAGRT